MNRKSILIIIMCALLTMAIFTGCGKDEDSKSKSGSSASTSSSAEEITNFEYNESEKSVSITAYTADDAKVIIPDKINGKAVTEIGQYVFYGKDFITDIEIPATVDTIGMDAFSGTAWYDGLTDEFAVIGDGVMVKYNGSAADVTIPDNVKSIYAGFKGSETLKSVKFNDGIKSIGNEVFYLCSNLSKVSIPASITDIGYMAFCDCKALSAIEVSADNEKYISEDGILYNKEKTELICYPAGKTDKKELKVADSVAVVSNCAFIGTSLEKITLPDALLSIGLYTFNDCKSLKEINIPSATTRIGEAAFYNCPALESIKIPKSVTDIGTRAFAGCKKLENITIPKSVTTMGGLVFSGCEALSDISCGADKAPEGWNADWNAECDADVSWGE